MRDPPNAFRFLAERAQGFDVRIDQPLYLRSGWFPSQRREMEEMRVQVIKNRRCDSRRADRFFDETSRVRRSPKSAQGNGDDNYGKAAAKRVTHTIVDVANTIALPINVWRGFF